MTIREAIEGGHRRIRLPMWINADDYLLLDLFERQGERVAGPYGHLYSEAQLIMGYERPQNVLLVNDRDERWEPYVGTPATDER